jgi:hypothetical protein
MPWTFWKAEVFGRLPNPSRPLSDCMNLRHHFQKSDRSIEINGKIGLMFGSDLVMDPVTHTEPSWHTKTVTFSTGTVEAFEILLTFWKVDVFDVV